jgi:hypothetical protein
MPGLECSPDRGVDARDALVEHRRGLTVSSELWRITAMRLPSDAEQEFAGSAG